MTTGVAVECRAVITRTDPRITAGPQGARYPGWSALLKKSEIADAPREGDELAILEGSETGEFLVRTLEESEFSPYWKVVAKRKPT